jgi:hypothetical protein
VGSISLRKVGVNVVILFKKLSIIMLSGEECGFYSIKNIDVDLETNIISSDYSY